MHLGNRHHNQKFPKFPDPPCCNCKAKLSSIIVMKQEPAGSNITFTCRSTCPKCGTNHLGTRVVGLSGKHMRLISQNFDAVHRIPSYVLPAAIVGMLTLAGGGIYWMMA